jgi:hypothetical protein
MKNSGCFCGPLSDEQNDCRHLQMMGYSSFKLQLQISELLMHCLQYNYLFLWMIFEHVMDIKGIASALKKEAVIRA